VQEKWRAVAPNLVSGFPIGPFVHDLGSLAALWKGDPLPDRAVSLHFETDGADYGAQILLGWRQIAMQ
jgi:hypothetical protein